MVEPLIEIIGTIVVVQPPTFDMRFGQYTQKLILENCLGNNTTEVIPSRILVMSKSIDPIPFIVGDPITVKGMFKSLPPGELSYIYSTHAPQGYIRYKGRILR